MCKNREETQTHILEECPVIHNTEQYKTKPQQYFNDNILNLRKTATNISINMIMPWHEDGAECSSL
jgi:hypothetical protein